MKPIAPSLLWAPVLLMCAGCSLRSMAVNTIADTLASSAEVYASDEDPELVRDALPFSLKTVESLLASSPEHEGLLLTACSGFTQYANAFIQTDADLVEYDDYEHAVELRRRALRMYLRARDYCLRRLEVEYPGIGERLRLDPQMAVAGTALDDVPVLYWLGAAWGLAISLGLDRPELVADLPAMRTLMARVLELDEDYQRGAVHGAMIVIESVPEVMGGSPERARKHFERAVELSKGLDASIYVTLASNVSLPAQNRAEFEELVRRALAVDPNEEKVLRLLNLITQKRARHLLAHIDDLFAEPASRPCTD
jgi:predicted anti-sigma-YlaC factor YlaD